MSPFHLPTLKTFLFSLLIALWAYMAPLHVMVISVLVAVCVDMVFGIAVAIKQKVKVTSNEMRRTISKVVAYMGSILVVHLISHGILGDLMPLTNCVATIIALAEAKSILENLGILTGQQNFMGSILAKVNSISGSDGNDKGE
jgi:hypothetical protein